MKDIDRSLSTMASMNSHEKNSALLKYENMVANHEIVFDELQVNVLEELRKYEKATRWWDFLCIHKKPRKKGIYLHGDVGRGKSLLSGIFYDCCAIERKKKVHFNTFMRSIHDLLNDVSSDFTQSSDDKITTTLKTFLGRIELLYLDEIQAQDICEARILHRVFSFLFSNNLVVLMTSNYSPDRLYTGGIFQDLFEPAIALIEKNMEVISLSGKQDYRALKGNLSCRHYIGENAEQQLRDHFLQFVGDKKILPLELTVNNRKIKVGEECSDIAWFSFDDICGDKNPLWTADYHEIAKRFATIFVSKVPVFDFYSQNAMHRFIVLIDEIYERRNRLFCSLNDEIEKLYVGAHRMDFKRAASRLREMGSDEW